MSQSMKYSEPSGEMHERLLAEKSEDALEGSSSLMASPRRQRRYQLLTFLPWVLLTASILVGSYTFSQMQRKLKAHNDQLVFSPAGEALRYQRFVFPDAFSTKTEYMGEPGPQLDAKWEEIYNLPTRIPKWQAEKLEQPTIELPDDPGNYVILLDIFHSMHCLNEIRKTLHPEHYTPFYIRANMSQEDAQSHLDHCVEHVRLALWCNADISPISFRWKKDGHSVGMHGYHHTCRDSEAILEWARENRLRTPLP
ncbi:hypothetical protein BU24DRAFT_465548 [Aaosphaeria arxii CBS 175.79]|uniref:Tat pathway signal sequence n=1 Tax=Aaosphaeria arxii CBS 175.79 TaxID=1450172 RepID=A0A6A5XGC2_9PLEO|nr:uncharacterized protein BU24DRAFT_465548 [Aaosphaeria arxii CBS 175.79]KAF2011970.1 hypothetical protein BU24DRAFT_465548 [Aaosphaeria arxii CBS 175.79]